MPGGSVAALVVPNSGITLALLRGSLVPSSEESKSTCNAPRIHKPSRSKSREPRYSVNNGNTTITRETKSPIRIKSNRGSVERDKSEAFKQCKERSPNNINDDDKGSPPRHGSRKRFEECNIECKERSPTKFKDYDRSSTERNSRSKKLEGYRGKIPIRTWKSEYQKRESSPLSRDRSKTRSRECKRGTRKTCLHREETEKDYEQKNKCRRCLDSELTRAIDVRYINNLKSYIEKIRCSYTCDPFECAALKDRLEKHRNEQQCASQQRKGSPLQWNKIHDSELHRSPRQSSGHHDKCNSCNSLDNNTTQTKLTFADLGNLTIKIESNDGNYVYYDNQNRYTQLDNDEKKISCDYERDDRTDHCDSWADDKYDKKSGCIWHRCSKHRRPRKYLGRSCKQDSKTDYCAPYKDTNILGTNLKSRKKDNEAKFTLSRWNSDRDFKNKKNSKHEFSSQEVNNESDCNKNDSKHTIPLVNTETHDCLTPKYVNISYEQNVKEVVKEWIQKFSLNNCNQCSSMDKENNANHLINKIVEASKDTDIYCYEVDMTREIKKCLDNLKIRCTGDKREVQMVKDGLCADLLERLIKIRNKWMCNKKINDDINDNQSRIRCSSIDSNKCQSEHSIRRTVNSEYICKSATKIKPPCKKYCNTCNNNIEEEILAWLDELNLIKNDKTQLVTREDVVEILKNRVSPYLKNPFNTTSRIILKAKIFEILDDLPININSTNNERVLLIRHADELANKLLSLQVRLDNEKYGRTKCYMIVNDTLSKVDLRDYILSDLKYCLDNNDVEIHNYTEDDIVDTLVRNFGSMSFNHDSRVKTAIIRILEAKEELSQENILNIAECILENLRDIKQKYTDKLLNDNPMKSLAQSCITVYTSEHDISGPSFITLHSSTIKKESDASLKRNLSKLNQEEMAYVEKNLRYEILNWLNEHSSEIYSDIGKATHKKVVEELALNIQPRLINNRPSKEISKEVAQWLKQVTNVSSEKNVENMSKKLAKRLTKLPQDAKRRSKRIDKGEEKAGKWNKTTNTSISFDISDITNPDETIKELILKYMDYSFDSDDSTARRAFTALLKTELQRLCTPTRKEVYQNFRVNSDQIYSIEKLHKELQYIFDISDWLKIIPVESSFNTVNNKQRIEFVNSLAKNIAELEEQKLKVPDVMDYNMYKSEVLRKSIRQLPLLPNQECNITLMMDQLLSKIAAIITNDMNSTLNSTRMSDQNLSDFLEEYILINGREIAGDELKLDAWSKRLVELIKKIGDSNDNDPVALPKAKVYERLSSMPYTQEPVKRFSFELRYAKEISEWLKNLPFLNSLADIEVNMISNLSEKISERANKKAGNANDTQADTDLVNHISNWISELPLDNSKELFINVAIQQLLNRIDMLNKEKNRKHGNRPQLESQGQINVNRQKRSCKQTDKYTCCRRKSCTSKPCLADIDSDGLMVEVIEKWCNDLPMEGSVHSVKSVKNKIAMKLLLKLGELTDNPILYNNDHAFINIFAEEANSELRNVPRRYKIKGDEENLKTSLLEKVMQAKNVIKERDAGELYKQKLESTIETSMPNPIQVPLGDDPCFQIYKHRLAEKFILDNFDHEDEAVKLNYEKRIQSDVDKYFQNAQLRNGVTITKEELCNELYSTLFKVPIPNKNSIKDEVEKIKTRCEIDLWFDELPLREAIGVGELLEWDQILKILAKQIHEVEKGNKSDYKIHEEIFKWLTKLPLRSGEERNIDFFAETLKNRLKTSAKVRKCITANESPIIHNGDINTRNSFDKMKSKSKQHLIELGRKNEMKTNGRRKWSNPTFFPQEYQQGVPEKKAADILLETVGAWCNQLPLYAQNRQEDEQIKSIKDDLVTKVMTKINKLNKDAETINDDALYDNLLHTELETLISILPQNTYLEKSKNARIFQLLETIKPLVKEEKSRHYYRLKLNDVVIKTLPQAKHSHGKEETHIKCIKEDMVDHFIEYIYNSGDNINQQFHKRKIHEATSKYLSKANIQKEPLMTGNQLICEMLKVPEPSEIALRDEVQEIRMKNEVNKFFDELEISEHNQNNKLITGLAIKLNEIENTGHTSENDQKIKKQIAKVTKKLGVNISPERIGGFISSLKQNESFRKAPSSRIHSSNNENTRKAFKRLSLERITQLGSFIVPNDSPDPSQQSHIPAVSPSFLQSSANLNWNTVLSSDDPQSRFPKEYTNMANQSYQQRFGEHPVSQAGKSPVFHTLNSTDGLPTSSHEQVFGPLTHDRGMETSFGQSLADYSGFNQGVVLSSTVQQGDMTMSMPAQQTFHTYIGADTIYDPFEEYVSNTQFSPGKGRYFQLSGGSVQPWNTMTTLGSVQQPTEQAIVMVHQPVSPVGQYIAEESLRTPVPILETSNGIHPYYSQLPETFGIQHHLPPKSAGNSFGYESSSYIPQNTSASRYPMTLQPADINPQTSAQIRGAIPQIIISSPTITEIDQSGTNIRSSPPNGIKTSVTSGTGESASTAQVASPEDVGRLKPAVLRLDTNEANCLSDEDLCCDCEICVRSRRKPLRPYCVIPMLQYCESVDDFLPMCVRYPCRIIY